MDAQGKVLIPLDEEQVRAAVARGCRPGRRRRSPSCSCTPTAIPRTSSASRQIVRRHSPALFVTASHELSQEYREFERTSTAAANAYVGPRVRGYLGEMGEHLEAAGFAGDFLIVQSTGGLFGVEEAQTACIRMLESGPAAGVIGTKALCDGIGLKNAIAFDMGGTTAKAGVIHDGGVLMTGNALVGGYATGAAGADSDDRHPGGRHRRRSIARVETGARCASGRKARARSPGRSATAAAAPSRPSPTPTASSAGSAPTASSAARCGSTSTAPSARCAKGRQAARPRSDRGRRRHPAHRRHQDVAHGAMGHDRARPRRRRLHARRLWRRRAAARRDGRARTAHRARS